MAASFQEVGSVNCNNSGLIGLRDVGKDRVDHGNKHAVLVGVAGVLDNRDDVGSLLGHVDQVAA